jgi:hypothetical protein
MSAFETGLVIGVFGGGVLVLLLAWVILRSPLPRRWQCESCGHGLSAHFTERGAVGSCTDGRDGGIASVLTGTCACRGYIGKVPEVGRIHVAGTSGVVDGVSVAGPEA